jgi:cytochrome c oxidase subunit II
MISMPFQLLLAATPPADGPAPATFWLPPQASTAAPEVDMLFMGINYLCYFFFFLIVGLMVVFAIKYRQRGREVHARGPTHHTALELTWSVLPLLLVIVMFYVGFRGYLNLSTPPLDSYEIGVQARQWSWDFTYPNGASSSNTDPDGLVVPAGRPVKLVMRSADVLHSLYIKDFRVKKDVVPGRTTYLWFDAPFPTGKLAYNTTTGKSTIPENGDFHWLFCTEYCGKDHSNMNSRVHVLEQADFDTWLAEKARWIEEIAPEDLPRLAGPKMYARCSQCHSLDGSTGIGPSWGAIEGYKGKTIWERLQNLETKFADGTSYADIIGPGKEFETPEDYVINSIVNPGKHLVNGFGNAMPTFRGLIPDKGHQAIIGMMKNLDKFDEKGKWKEEAPAATP